jgi:hypothetical protein
VYFNVLHIEPFSAPMVWDIRVLEPFPSFFTNLRVSSDTLKDLGGSLLDSPMSADFPGLIDAAVSTPERISAGKRYSIRDLANPPAPRLPDTIAGTLIIGADGDYAQDEGSELVRKLIMRRLTTGRGGFYHLPEYGEGLKVKQPLPAGDLISFQGSLQRSIKREKEVKEAQVTVRQDGNSLVVVARVQLENTGQMVEVSTSIPFGVEL